MRKENGIQNKKLGMGAYGKGYKLYDPDLHNFYDPSTHESDASNYWEYCSIILPSGNYTVVRVCYL